MQSTYSEYHIHRSRALTQELMHARRRSTTPSTPPLYNFPSTERAGTADSYLHPLIVKVIKLDWCHSFDHTAASNGQNIRAGTRGVAANRRRPDYFPARPLLCSTTEIFFRPFLILHRRIPRAMQSLLPTGRTGCFVPFSASSSSYTSTSPCLPCEMPSSSTLRCSPDLYTHAERPGRCHVVFRRKTPFCSSMSFDLLL